jgi:hypothetical protein
LAMPSSSAVALAPEIGGAVVSRLETLLAEVFHTFQKDILRIGLLTAGGIAMRQLAAVVGAANLPRMEPTTIIGLTALLLSLVTAAVARLGCVGSQGEFDASCGLLAPGGGTELATPPTPTGFSLVSFVQQRPWEVTLVLMAIVAIDRNDIAVRLLDEIVHGWKWLLGLLSAKLGHPRALPGGQRNRQGRDHARRPSVPKKMPPLPPTILRKLTRHERRQLEIFRRMAATDPFQALHDCLEVLGWQACRALFM